MKNRSRLLPDDPLTAKIKHYQPRPCGHRLEAATDPAGCRTVQPCRPGRGRQEGGPPQAFSLAEDARACLDAGARIVLIEAAELVSDDPETARAVGSVVEAVGPERLMFELPGPWIAGVSAFDIHRLRNLFIERFGPEVNLGNVRPVDLISLEAYRRGLGVNAGKR